MLGLCLVIALRSLLFSLVFGENTKDFELDACRLQLSCPTKSHVTPEIPTVVGRPGKSGPPGIQGPRGYQGAKGDKGESCDCQKELNNIKERMDVYKCPQTKFSFTEKSQVKDWIRVKKPLLEFSEVSVCTWITSNDMQSVVSGAYLSYATSSQPNEFLLYFINGLLEIYVKGQVKNTALAITTKTHVCIVIQRNEGLAKVFRNGVLHENLSYPNKSPVAGGGSLVIGQEQDEYLGGFVASESFYGTMENFMLWYRAIDDKEITALYNSRCSCPTGYSIALTPDEIQFEGKVRTLPMQQC